MADFKKIFDKCFFEIGGDSNEDVFWYKNERPTIISRKDFFKEAVVAMWGSGIKRKSRDTFLKCAKENGFNWDFKVMSKWDGKKLQSFTEKLHGNCVKKQAHNKWKAVIELAKKLDTFSSENDFRKMFFQEKIKTSDLDKSDVQNLKNKGLPFIKEANSQYIIRNIGGEAIKCDRWIDTFINYYNISLINLENELIKLQIPLGLFDVVIWAYCEKFIKKTNQFEKHFNQIFP